MTVRITISDPEQTVSFVGSVETAMRLVAACSVTPRDKIGRAHV